MRKTFYLRQNRIALDPMLHRDREFEYNVSPNIRTYKNGKVETRNGETNEKVTQRRKKKETEATIRSEEKGIAVRDRYTREGSVSAA